MPNYIVFGGCLDSPLSFPQLPVAAADTAATWVVSEVDVPIDSERSEFLGENQITSKAKVRLYRTTDGFRLHYDDSGIFDIRSDGRSIDWVPGDAANPANVREDILGPVLATAMHMAGRLCLHGSSVVLPTGAVAFLAPKHFGKSTIAMAMMERGARLLTDDSLPVEPGPPVMACPGVASVRFWDDTRGRFHRDGQTVQGSGGKHAATDLADKAQLYDRQPLQAIYLLAPFKAEEGDKPVRRESVAGIQSALALVEHAKIGALLGKTESPVMLDRAVALARNVPVYALRIARDLDSLGAVADQMLSWHSEASDAGLGPLKSQS